MPISPSMTLNCLHENIPNILQIRCMLISIVNHLLPSVAVFRLSSMPKIIRLLRICSPSSLTSGNRRNVVKHLVDKAPELESSQNKPSQIGAGQAELNPITLMQIKPNQTCCVELWDSLYNVAR